MSEAIYLEDSYLKEFEAKVESVASGKFVVLDRSAFYPKSGGQPFDTGILKRKSDGKEFRVVFVIKIDGNISHEVEDCDLKKGDEVIGRIDWERRYAHMKAHTSAHILAEALYRRTGALTTGNQLSDDICRIDSDFDYDPDVIKQVFDDANDVIQKDISVTAKNISREEAEKLPNMTKLAKGLPADIKTVRIVSVGDYDHQADGGTHVKSTSEIGSIEFVKYNSKGKNNKRLYFKVTN
ncbi:MAG: alanyl-tRNA editing protein [Nanobdellota archaeon]